MFVKSVIILMILFRAYWPHLESILCRTLMIYIVSQPYLGKNLGKRHIRVSFIKFFLFFSHFPVVVVNKFIIVTLICSYLPKIPEYARKLYSESSLYP